MHLNLNLERSMELFKYHMTAIHGLKILQPTNNIYLGTLMKVTLLRSHTTLKLAK